MPFRALNSNLIVKMSGNVVGGSASFLMHSTLTRYSGLNASPQLAGPRMCTPQSPMSELPKS